MTPSCPTIAWPIAPFSRCSSSAARVIVFDSISMYRPFAESSVVLFVEQPAPHRLDQGNGLPQLVGTAHAGVVDRRSQRAGIGAGEFRDFIDAIARRQARIRTDAPPCRL